MKKTSKRARKPYHRPALRRGPSLTAVTAQVPGSVIITDTNI